MAKSALKLGGIAGLGALAYHAYTRYNRSQGAAEAAPTTGHHVTALPDSRTAAVASAAKSGELSAMPVGSGFVPDASDHESVQSIGATLIRAMIAAAKADGQIDSVEGQHA